jgi:hypothetical protein
MIQAASPAVIRADVGRDASLQREARQPGAQHFSGGASGSLETSSGFRRTNALLTTGAR